MISNIIFIQSEKDFKKKEKKKIRNIIKTTANRVAKILKLSKNKKINFSVYFAKINSAEGLTITKDYIRLDVPLRKKLDEVYLKNTVSHEIYHTKKDWVYYLNKRVSLIEALFQEGSASVFSLEMTPGYYPKCYRYAEKFIKKWLPEVKKEKYYKYYSNEEWFFGAKEKPFNLGYKLGTYLVEQIKKYHPELTADKLVGKDAKELLKLSKVKL
jgi:uncharacterized protein YjaZ